MPNRMAAVYKEQKVTVYIVNKNEISLARSDLIELINVRISFIDFINSSTHLFTSVCGRFGLSCHNNFFILKTQKVFAKVFKYPKIYMYLVFHFTHT